MTHPTIEDDAGDPPPHLWAEIPGAPRPPARTRTTALVGPLILAVLGGALAVLGHRRRGAVVLGGALVLGLVLHFSPSVRTRIERIAAFVARWAAVGISVAFLVPAYYLVITPLGLLMRLLGGRPLDLSWDADRSSYWSARARGSDPTPRRMYTDQRGWSPVGFSRRQRRRLVLNTVMAVVLVEIAVAGGGYYVTHRPVPEPPPSGVASIAAPRSAALRNLDWAPAAFRDTSAAAKGIVFTPFTGASVRDYEGTHVNVKNRVRKSYETPLAATQRPLDVWFFGGSTMFGFDIQRDMYTIPSDVVRLAEQSGIAIRARNYGAPGYVNYQETMLLSLLLTGGERPDLIVFYDGVNDFALALLDTIGGLNPRGEPGDLGAGQQRRALATSGELPGGTDQPPAPLGLRPSSKPITAQLIVDDAVAVYRQGFDLSQLLAAEHRVPILHFWQPSMYSKQPLDPGEEELFPTLALEPARLGMLRELERRVRAALPDEVVDISDALDRVEGPVLSDVVHVNETGGQAVADAMFVHLLPELERLTTSR